MRAAQFFRVLRSGREVHERERSLLLMDLCEVGAISQSFEHYKNAREHFRERAFPRVVKALPADDLKTAQIAAAMFRAGRVMPHPIGVMRG